MGEVEAVESATFSAAPTAGNLIVLCVGADKNCGAFGTPAGFTLIDQHDGSTRSEIGGALFYKIADGSETGQIVTTWANAVTATAEMQEIRGPFSASPLKGQGADKTEANASTVTLTTTGSVDAPAVALAFYTNDSAKNGANATATNGFTPSVGTNAVVPNSLPAMISARKVVTADGVVSTVIGHDGTADGSIGFIAVFG